jgi:tellurite resistance protein TerC
MSHGSAYRWAKRIAVSVIGFTVLLVGVALLVLPGPGLVVIVAGLAILGLEFAWARAWLARAREKGTSLARAATERMNGRPD